jgi:acyl-CoA synthetase (NDP forming)
VVAIETRDSSHSLDALFSPRSVVVVGASTQAARVSGRPLGFLRDWGFSGEIAVVNPRRDAVLGYPSYPSAADVPFVPDLAVVCVPATSVLEALEQCAARGVRAAVVFAAGFSEITDGCPDEGAIRELSVATGMAVCGPNCLGTISVDDSLPATFSTVLSETTLRSGDVALVTQSGALGIYLYAEAARRGVGFSRWVSTGNECALTISDYIEWLVNDERTRVICAYIEGIRDGDRFRHVLAAAKEAGKPVIVLKGGRSESGAHGVESHTGAIAGDATVFSGVLAGAGAREVDDATELLEVATLERLHPDLPADRGVAIATTSGGGAILASDWLTRCGLRAATLASATVATIDDVIPSFGRAENPVDFTGNLMNDPDMVKVAVEALSRDPDVAATVVFVGVGGETADLVVDAILRADIPDSRILAVVWIGASALVRERLGEGGIPVFADVGPCIRALARLWRPSSTDTAAAAEDADRSPVSAGATLEILLEHDLKGQLREAGLSVPPGWLVETGSPPLQLDRNKTYAVKGQARGVVHKVAHGLVRLHCEPDDVDAACAEIAEAAHEQQLELDGVLVEEMAEAGVEFLVTLRRDPTFGWTVLVGGGGDDVESKRDIVARPCPLTPAAAATALDTLAVSESLAKLVDPTAARQAAIGLLVQISASLDRLPTRLIELELNPVIVTPKHAMIVDAVAFVAP